MTDTAGKTNSQPKTILLVDDEINLLHSLARLLRKEGYRILTATTALDGLALLEQYTVHVVISDYKMPEISGTQFLQRVKTDYPDTVRVILSGYADTRFILEAINKGEIFRFILKPWVDAEFKQMIQDCLQKYENQIQKSFSIQKLEHTNSLVNLSRQVDQVFENSEPSGKA